jgi:C1A family cysteine protease
MANEKFIKWYGWVPDQPDIRDKYRFKIAPAIAELPAKVDLRSDQPPMYNQFSLGSCTAQMGVGIFQYNQMQQNIGWPEMPSRLFVYYNTRKLQGTIPEDSGASIRDTIKAIVKYGVCKASHWPYILNRFTNKPTQHCYNFAKKHTAVVYERVNQNINEIKAVLASKELIGIGFSVYDGFESQECSRTGVLNMPLSHERLLGGHAVVIVGYDDEAQRVIVRNSWGDDWGANGYFTMPYEYLLHSDLASDFWTIKIVK